MYYLNRLLIELALFVCFRSQTPHHSHLDQIVVIHDVRCELQQLDPGDQCGTGPTSATAPQFTLDSPIEAEGSNLSIGQRSLVSGITCARASQRQQNFDPG